MLGDSSDLTTAAGPGEAGLIPRICIELFQRLGLTNAERGCSISSCRSGQASIQVSFCEVNTVFYTQGYTREDIPFFLQFHSHGRDIALVQPSSRLPFA